MTGSDAVGLTMGYYDTTALPIYQYLHAAGHPRLRDRRQLLPGGVRRVVPEPPVADRGAHAGRPDALNDGGADDLHSVLDANGMPTQLPAVHAARRRSRDQRADRNRARRRRAAAGAAGARLRRLRRQHDRSRSTSRTRRARRQRAAAAADDADDRRPADRRGRQLGVVLGRLVERQRRRRRPGLDERHRRPRRRPALDPDVDRRRRGVPELPGQALPVPPPAVQLLRQLRARHAGTRRAPPGRGRSSSRPPTRRRDAAASKPVSFIKPVGEENEHPGYASEPDGSDHLVNLLKAIEGSACAKDTMVIVTYDEFGGQWDHVPPPGQGNAPARTTIGARARASRRSSSRRTCRATSSSTSRARHDVDPRHDRAALRAGPLATRDAAVPDLSSVFSAKKPKQ